MATPPVVIMVYDDLATDHDDYVLHRCIQALCLASYVTFVLFAGRVAACWRHSVATKPCRAGLHPLQLCQRVAGCRIYAQSQRRIDLVGRSSYRNILATEQTAWKRSYLAISDKNDNSDFRSSFAVRSTFARSRCSRRSVPLRFRMQ